MVAIAAALYATPGVRILSVHLMEGESRAQKGSSPLCQLHWKRSRPPRSQAGQPREVGALQHCALAPPVVAAHNTRAGCSGSIGSHVKYQLVLGCAQDLLKSRAIRLSGILMLGQNVQEIRDKLSDLIAGRRGVL